MSAESKEIIQQTSIEWGANDLQNMLTNQTKYTEQLEKDGVQFLEFDQKDYQTIINKAGDPYEHARKSLIDAKVDPKVVDKFIKRWRELNEEYEKNYLSQGKTWQYK